MSIWTFWSRDGNCLLGGGSYVYLVTFLYKLMKKSKPNLQDHKDSEKVVLNLRSP